MNPIITCPWEPATFLFISSNVPLLINYSHFIAIFSALVIALTIFYNNPKSVVARLFFLFSALFSIWALLDVNLWATNDPGIVLFSWSMQILLEPLIYAIAFLLFYIHIKRQYPPLYIQVTIFYVLLPLILLLPTTLNLEAVQLSTCESIEGPLALYYTYIANAFFITLILLTAFKNLPKLSSTEFKSGLIFLVGLITFLLAFTSGNVISSFTDNWTISQYGLFGMPLFASLIAYSMVKFNTFKIQVAGSQVLVIVLWTLVCSLLFINIELSRIIVLVTLLFTTVSGYLLISSVRKEIKQREQIEELAKKLARANKRLRELDKSKSEFVSIASHQLRSPLTAMRGYASMLLEGSYGPISKRASTIINRIADSCQIMIMSVEDYLNVSRIESGNMKYELSDFNIKDRVEHIVNDKRTEAIQKGLLLLFKSNLNKKGIVHADIGKTEQIIHNLINNAMKYTPKGTITVYVHEDVARDKVIVSISDTGIGMSDDAIEDLFGKFSRASNANSVNVSGTGLGLYVAKALANGMNGDITASSRGEGKGSVFSLELPLVM